jgi:hypothetical protein
MKVESFGRRVTRILAAAALSISAAVPALAQDRGSVRYGGGPAPSGYQHVAPAGGRQQPAPAPGSTGGSQGLVPGPWPGTIRHGGSIIYPTGPVYSVTPGGVRYHYLPPGYSTHYWNDTPYYWYPTLPLGYATYYYGGVPYYYVNGLWLRPYWLNGRIVYIVVNPPL